MKLTFYKQPWFLVLAFLVSLGIVALGKPLYIGSLAPFSALCGFTLFWYSLSTLKNKKVYFSLALIWFALISALELSWMSSTEWVGPMMLIVYIGVALCLGLEFALLSLLFYQKQTITFGKVLAIAGLWTILEWSRLFFLSGFTFNVVGSALTYSRLSIQLTAVLGIYGLSFWVIFVNACGYLAFVKRKAKYFSLWLLLALFPYGFGYLHETYQKSQFSAEKQLSALLIQTALTPAQKEPVVDRYKEFIRPEEQWIRILSLVKKAKGQVDLVVLPEVALPFSAFESFYHLDIVMQIWEKSLGIREKDFFLPLLKKPLAQNIKTEEGSFWKVSNAFWAQAIANYLNSDVIIGLDDQDSKKKNYNAAFYFQPFKNIIRRYEKQVLVPIVEYFPFEWCAKIAAEYGISGVFTPGKKARVFPGKAPMGVSICYEETYGNLMRKSRLKGAELFVNISNDGWFPMSSLPQKHFELGRVRAVENGVPLIRSCNTGVTVAVDSFGDVLQKFGDSKGNSEELFGGLFLQVPLNHYSTLYTLWGDLFIVSISFLSVGFYFWGRRKKRLITENK